MPAVPYPSRHDPATWYPAGVADVREEWYTLAPDESVRVVRNVAPPDPGRTVLLLHGWGCNAYHYRRLFPALARRGIHAVAPDLRGHGRSAKPRDAARYRGNELAAFVERLMETLQLDDVGLLGHSLGGAAAIDVAARRVRRVRWLLLLNPVGLSRMNHAGLLARLPLSLAERTPAWMSRAIGTAALHLAYGRITRPERGDLEQYLYPTLQTGGRFGLVAYATSYDWGARSDDVLRRIACPMTVLLGERDRVVHAREALARLAPLPQARVDVIARAGHVLAEEAPEVVADAAQALAVPNESSRVPDAKR
jgi:pimeloyl-ACP methyl ester carboxylesterase